MASLTRWERTVPSLLDRLTENGGPGQPANPDELFVTPQRFLESIRRDLVWLLKTEITRPSEVPLEDRAADQGPEAMRERPNEDPAPQPHLGDFPQTCASALAFGVPSLRGGQGLRST